jgi:magnesium chelatase subunit H
VVVTHPSALIYLTESKGLFTSTNPETRRVTVDADGRVKVKVVYVVLEAQYQSALSATVKRINSTNKQVRRAITISVLM